LLTSELEGREDPVSEGRGDSGLHQDSRHTVLEPIRDSAHIAGNARYGETSRFQPNHPERLRPDRRRHHDGAAAEQLVPSERIQLALETYARKLAGEVAPPRFVGTCARNVEHDFRTLPRHHLPRGQQHLSPFVPSKPPDESHARFRGNWLWFGRSLEGNSLEDCFYTVRLTHALHVLGVDDDEVG
jgi:hypothetical protein